MPKLIYTKLKGSILEPMIALMIIIFSLTAAFSAVITAYQKNNIPQNIRAIQLSGSLINTCMSEEEFVSETEVRGDLIVEKEIEWYNRELDLLLITINIYNNKKRILCSRKQIIKHDESYR